MNSIWILSAFTSHGSVGLYASLGFIVCYAILCVEKKDCIDTKNTIKYW